ncbi:MAG: type II secretion system protein [Candidatus Omnitrophota bacterium]
MKKRGFTLIELVMVIVILGIISAIAVPKFTSFISDSKGSATKGGLGAIRSVLAIQYAKSATSGVASFPALITTDFFSDGKVPRNSLNNQTGVTATNADPGSKPTSASAGWWYNSVNGDLGAYSDGTVETSDW